MAALFTKYAGMAIFWLFASALLGLSHGQYNQYPQTSSGGGTWNNQPTQNDQYSQYQQPQAGNPYNPGYPQGVGQQTSSARTGVPMRFCTVSDDELNHCKKMVWDLDQVNLRSGGPPPPPGQVPRGKRQAAVKFQFSCVKAADKLECMKWIGGSGTPKADVVLATPGEAYIGGTEYKLIPFAYEGLGDDRVRYEDQVVALVRGTLGIDSMDQLRGRMAYLGPVGDTTWDLTLAHFRQGSASQFPAPTCQESYMDTVSRYFGDSCAPYDMTKFSDDENNRYRKLCNLCGGQACPPAQQRPTSEDTLSWFLQNERAEVAFVKTSVLSNALRTNSFPEPHMYQVLCPHLGGSLPLVAVNQPGAPRSVQEWSECFVGRIPSHAWLTRPNAENVNEMGSRLLEIFFHGGGPATTQPTGMRSQWLDGFFLGKYPDNQRVTRFLPVFNMADATMESYLDGFLPYINDKISCPAQERAKWCTTSKADQEKCMMMKQAFKAHRLRPELECDAPVKNSYVCLDKIQKKQADLALIDIGDFIQATSTFNAMYIAQERYLAPDSQNPIDEPFSVAVVKDAGLTTLQSLQGKRACFTGLWEAHGFMLPMNQLKLSGLVSPGDCHHLSLAQGFFGDSCLPGLADIELNPNNEPKDKLCKQCEGGEKGCSRNGDSRFAGGMGALRCLREGKGDVAFVPHTVLSEIPQSEQGSYYLLCSGGSQPLTSYESCNLGKAPGGVLVTSKDKPIQERRRLQEMILTASRLFSSDPSSQFQSGPFQSGPLSSGLGSTNTDRSRKTYKLFGKRQRSLLNEITPYGGASYPAPQPSAPQLRPGSGPTPQAALSASNYLGPMSPDGEYALFGPGTYDLRGFQAADTTTNYTIVNNAEVLQSYQFIGERSDWKTCYVTGAGSRLFSGAFVLLFGLLGLRVFLL